MVAQSANALMVGSKRAQLVISYANHAMLRATLAKVLVQSNACHAMVPKNWLLVSVLPVIPPATTVMVPVQITVPPVLVMPSSSTKVVIQRNQKPSVLSVDALEVSSRNQPPHISIAVNAMAPVSHAPVNITINVLLVLQLLL